MAKETAAKEERLATLSRATSPSMLRLLGNLIHAIDDRHLTLDDYLQVGNGDTNPVSCDMCNGTGIVLVPTVASDDEDDGATTNVPPATTTNVPPATTNTSGPSAAAAAVAPPAPGVTASSTQTAQDAPLPTVIIPPATSPIAGFQSLGPNVLPPAPESAVYTGAGPDRFFTVTRGLRVGVFGGWMDTSPYVTGVSGASYSRHRTLHSAYEAYVKAYGRGIITHA
ncbi:hypothetical protein D9611_003465 [Ephemerocybe angulata]|uniref:Ribonuclease H1 N-terminal domain-containing protein n=1 Tax=Ephemerocybe angulata TaxID=980116 RepID=A0A8H5B5G4_9AGAR|nr:hypothetical protein D9611_003465 [Tulosesus angulatus]